MIFFKRYMLALFSMLTYCMLESIAATYTLSWQKYKGGLGRQGCISQDQQDCPNSAQYDTYFNLNGDSLSFALTGYDYLLYKDDDGSGQKKLTIENSILEGLISESYENSLP